MNIKHNKNRFISLVLLFVTTMFCSHLSFAQTESQTNTKDEYANIDIVVNVNTASADELATLLTGVGEKKAQAIVQYRNENGQFKAADDLVNVRGIGPALIEKNQSRLKF